MFKDERKLSKRQYITVVQTDRCEKTKRATGEGDIWTVYQYFQHRLKHKKGSNRPEGWFHSIWGGSDQQITVRWLYTEDLGYFAPEISFHPTAAGLKLCNKVAKALYEMRNCKDEGPERLMRDLKASKVKYVDDNKQGCWDDYQPDMSGNAMLVIARAAAGY